MKLTISLILALPLLAQPDTLAGVKTDDRIAVYQAMIAAQSDNLHYHGLLAGAYIQKMRETTDFSYLDRASQILTNVLSNDSRNYEALRLRTEIELERHNFKKAAEYSRELARISPNDPWNWGTLGDALIEMGDYEPAAEAYQKMVTLRPDLASYNRAAWYHFLANDMPGAIEIMKQAIASGNPTSENTAWCAVELGHLYMKSGQLEDAAKAYSGAIKMFPGYHPAYAGLGRAQAAQGDIKAAIASLERAQASTPLPDYAAALHDLYLKSGNKKKAAEQMELVDAIDQTSREKANRNLAMIYADHDHRLDRALELATAELDIRRDIYTYDTLAWAQLKNKKFADAEKSIAEAMKLSTPEPMFYFHAAKIALANGKEKEAAAYFEKARALNPHFEGL